MANHTPPHPDVILPPRGVCDFCSDGSPAWAYPATSFTLPGPDGRLYTSAGAWAACDACSALIERDDRRALFDRYLADKPAHVRPFLRPWGTALHERFFAHRTGPCVPTTPQYGFTPQPQEGRASH
ncbi:MAG TPA: hypothetical protein VGJ60_07450 [Chloroflexota bacterium]|jgi:hypothetical protein